MSTNVRTHTDATIRSTNGQPRNRREHIRVPSVNGYAAFFDVSVFSSNADDDDDEEEKEKEEKRDDDEKCGERCYSSFSLFFSRGLSFLFLFLFFSTFPCLTVCALSYVLGIHLFLSCSGTRWMNEVGRELLRLIPQMCSFSTILATNDIRLFLFLNVCEVEKFEGNIMQLPCVFSLEKLRKYMR